MTIKFHRRRIGCWGVCEDCEDFRVGLPPLEFNSEEELFDYIRKTLPFVNDETEYKLRIDGDCVMWWTVIGFIE